jgi:hypothetical protein
MVFESVYGFHSFLKIAVDRIEIGPEHGGLDAIPVENYLVFPSLILIKETIFTEDGFV